MNGEERGGIHWKKSSWSGSIECVEVARSNGDCVLVRHSKDPHGPVLRYTAAEWRAFVAGVKDDEFDV
jgi:hypothetical protein